MNSCESQKDGMWSILGKKITETPLSPDLEDAEQTPVVFPGLLPHHNVLDFVKSFFPHEDSGDSSDDEFLG